MNVYIYVRIYIYIYAYMSLNDPVVVSCIGILISITESSLCRHFVLCCTPNGNRNH